MLRSVTTTTMASWRRAAVPLHRRAAPLRLAGVRCVAADAAAAAVRAAPAPERTTSQPDAFAKTTIAQAQRGRVSAGERERARAARRLERVRLARLERAVAADVRRLAHPREPWAVGGALHSASKPNELLDVAIVGGGQAGVAGAFALRRANVDRVRVLDRAPRGLEGPWATSARMPHLRTPKQLVGLDGGISSLTFQSFFEARFSKAEWAALDKIPTQLWNEYLLWFRATTGIDEVVDNQTELESVEWLSSENAFRLRTRETTSEENVFGEEKEYLARTVVLARGRSSSWYTPPELAEAVPAARLFHSSDPALGALDVRGARVLVVGVGASGLDAAEWAARGGARVVALARRGARPERRPNFFAWAASNVGLLKHFGDLPDAARWQLMLEFQCDGEPAPLDTYERARANGVEFVGGASIARIAAEQDAEQDSAAAPITVELSDGRVFGADIVVAATGNALGAGLADDAALRSVAPLAARWRDRFAPPESPEAVSAALGVGEARVRAVFDSLLAQPYLSPQMALTAREPRRAAELGWLGGVFCFDYASMLSHGINGLGVSGLKYGVPRLTDAVTRRLFLADVDVHRQSWRAFRLDGVIDFEKTEPLNQNSDVNSILEKAGATAAASESEASSNSDSNVNLMPTIEDINAAVASNDDVALTRHFDQLASVPQLVPHFWAATKAAKERFDQESQLHHLQSKQQQQQQQRVFESAEEFAIAVRQRLLSLSLPAQIEILAAKNRFDTPLDGDLAKAAVAEHTKAGIGAESLPSGALERLSALLDAYELKFGWRFAHQLGNDSTHENIIEAIERRLANDQLTELTVGIEQVSRIVANRLGAIEQYLESLGAR